MQCPTCGHRNVAGAAICSSCGTALSQSSGAGQPISATPGIATGGTVGAGASDLYSPFLSKGVRLQGGNYAVGDLLGQGGFGITYKGGDMGLRRYVAIKEFFPAGCARQGNSVQPAGSLSAADYGQIKAKFIEEARVLARFSDPGIVRVFSVFEENNTAYMVMDFLEGETLSRRLQNKGVLDEGEAVGIIEKVGHALLAVHGAGLIHRDLKPDNICLTNDGRVVLIDFGTARSFAAGKTVRQTTMLTPGYAPLEQYGQQARFGSYTDIYALGATLYHCVTGEVPPPATDRVAGVTLKAPREVNPRLSVAVSQAIVWSMQLKADARPQTIQEFLDALKTAVTSTGFIPSVTTPSVITGMPGAMSASGTVLVDPAQFSSTTPSGAPAWPSAFPANQPGSASGRPHLQPTVQQIAENQLLTSADPHSSLQAVQHAFEAFGVAHPTIDSATFRVNGSTGMDVRSWQQNVVGQVTQDARGTVITVSSTPAGSFTDLGRGRDEVRRLLLTIEGSLRLPPNGNSSVHGSSSAPVQLSPTSPNPYAPSGAPIPNPSSSAPYSPNPLPPTPYFPNSRPMVQRRGGTILTMGLLGICCCGIFSPVAWIMGNQALEAYGDSDPGDRGTVQAGRIMGIIGTVIMGIGLSITVLGVLGASGQR